jgi:hypothetical protein
MSKNLTHKDEKFTLRSLLLEKVIPGWVFALPKVMKLRTIPGFVILFLLLSLVAIAQEVAAPASIPVQPFSTKEEIENYLRTAKVVRSKWLGTGVTNPRKLYLDDGKVQHPAVFKDYEERRFGITKLAGTAEYDFKDSWKFEVAAYELDKLIGLDMIPPTVERIWEGKKGAVIWWIDNAMTEDDRLKKNLAPPDLKEWRCQRAKMDLFDVLIYNIDRNQGNLLYNDVWRMFLIDHTRAFKSINMVRSVEKLTYFSRSCIDGLRKLDEKTVTERCKNWLSGAEIRTMMKRRDLILQHYEKLLAAEGESITFP